MKIYFEGGLFPVQFSKKRDFWEENNKIWNRYDFLELLAFYSNWAPSDKVDSLLGVVVTCVVSWKIQVFLKKWEKVKDIFFMILRFLLAHSNKVDSLLGIVVNNGWNW